jgi:DUF4097 and DUF4098 domain-containing protein YvlB
MKRNRQLSTWMGSILGVMAALLLNAALAHASDNVVTEEFHHTYNLAANGRVELDNINGAVHISAWDRNEVKVDAIKRARSEERLKEAQIEVKANDNSVSIATHYPERNWNDGDNPASVEYTLMVPRNAKLDEIKLINGALDVNGVLGEVYASCINGKLTANGLTNRARLQTINGTLNADFEKMPKEDIELQSVNGTVRLVLPSDAKASLEATTVHGAITNDFGLHTNDHRFVGHDMHGDLAGGGVHIKLNNVNGRIDISHANDGRAVSPAKNAGEQDKDDEI